MEYRGNFTRLYKIVQERMAQSGSCHDFDHVCRVMKNAEKLLAFYPHANREVVMLSALLHDVARPEEERSRGKCCHAAIGARLVPELLKETGFPEDIIPAVAEAVRTHRFRGKDEPDSLEADLIFDADKLDSLGAVGIGRAFLFAGHENARLHNTEAEALSSEAYSKEDTAYREYLVKLRYLPRKMRSEAGRKMAIERTAFMADFFEKLDKETDLGENVL